MCSPWKETAEILHYNSNTKWKSLLLSAPLMPSNQHVMGGCNQIILLRFGFPNSFPKLPSAHRSLAFRMRRETWREAKDFRTNLNNREGQRWLVRGGLIFPAREPAERVGENPLFPPSLSVDFQSVSCLFIHFVHPGCAMLQAHAQNCT